MWPFTKRAKPPPSRPPPQWNLSEPVLWLSDHDPWTIGDACQGCQIWGSTGSGKSSGSLAWILQSFMRMNWGGICLTAKPGDAELYASNCKATGRQEDLILFGPQHAARWNFIDSELKRSDRGAGHVENLVGLFSTVLEISERNKGGGREEDGYWKRTNRQLLRNSLELLVQAKGTITIPDLYRLVVSAPTSFEQLQSDAWRASSFCFQCLTDADAKVSPEKRSDLQLATDFFCLEWVQLSEKTRSIVLSTLTSMLDVLNRGVVRELLSPTETTVRPEMACDGKIIVVDMPLKLFGEIGQFVQIVWKYCFQQAMERRDLRSNPRPVFIVVDESHLLAVSSDQVFQTTARSSRTAVVYATQSLSNYLAAFGGEQSEAEVHSLLGNLQTQFFHQQVDTSKAGIARADTSRLKLRAGEFVASEVEEVMDDIRLVEAACAEIVEMTKDRKSVLIFASGIRHGQHVCDILRDKHGIECGFVTGSTPDEERDEILARFRGDTANGLFNRPPLKFLCNVNVLTTGFDAPNVDCVVLLRPTMSPGLFRHNSKPSGR